MAGEGCRVDCDLPKPCSEVLCTFDSAYDAAQCGDLENPEAIDCVIDGLESGWPMEASFREEDTYWGAALGEATYRFWVLGQGHVISKEVHSSWDDANGQSHYSERLRWGHVDLAKAQACRSLEGDEAFFCMVHDAMATDTCAEPSAYVCPARL